MKTRIETIQSPVVKKCVCGNGIAWKVETRYHAEKSYAQTIITCQECGKQL